MVAIDFAWGSGNYKLWLYDHEDLWVSGTLIQRYSKCEHAEQVATQWVPLIS